MGLIPHPHRVEDTPHAAREWVGHYTPSQFQTTSGGGGDSPPPLFRSNLLPSLIIEIIDYS